MKKIQWVLIVGLLVCLGVPRASWGQISSSAIVGVVRDATEAVIAGAEVTVTNVDTGISRTRESGASGLYRVGDLQPGTYQITVSMAGFNRETRRDLVLQVGREMTLNFTLQVGAVEQEVVVTGEAPVVETTISSVATNVSQEQLRELPLNGRSFADLVTLNPGAVTPHIGQGRGANYGFAPQLSVAGARTDANSFRIDGTDLMDTRNQSPGSAAGVQLGVDTIREFQIVTANGKAEYGRNAGAVINAVSRSGTNEWHGSAFEFIRNNKMDARRFENLGDLPPFKRNQFGVTLGGPIQRDKSFFFVGYEGLRQRLNESRVWDVPTADGRLGIGVLEPGEVVDPRIVPYLNLYPLPNGKDIGGGVGLLAADTSQPTTENFGSGRIDHNLSENDFFFARYTVSRADSSSVSQLLSDQASNTSRHLLTVQEDHIFGPNLLNTFRFGFNRSLGFSSPATVEGTESLGFAPGLPMGQISAGDVFSLGP
ncbi:MAG: carboxypeptidase regulatory-like domain-containing protein, partial [Acidobacteria bacterium]|nr:carboxypeptidase regulatory-like domain-containing protein [Acidobacteriota bacterium]